MERVRPNTPALPRISISEPSASLFLVIGDNEWVSLPASFLRSRKVLGAGGCLIASFHAARCKGECSTVQTQTQRGALPVAPRCVIPGLLLLYRKSLDSWSKGCGSFRVVMPPAIREEGECAIAGVLIRDQKDVSPFQESCYLGIARTRLLNPKILIRNSPQACNYSRWMTLPLAWWVASTSTSAICTCSGACTA